MGRDEVFSVKVDGIDENVRIEEIEDAFRKYGEISDVYIPREGGATGRSRGFAFVRFTKPDAADDACADSGKVDVNGKDVRVEMARSRPAPRQNRFDDDRRGRGRDDDRRGGRRDSRRRDSRRRGGRRDDSRRRRR